MRVSDLQNHGVPAFGIASIEGRGITTLHDVQESAVNAGLLQGASLIVMAPTSAGKTLVAELATLVHAVSRRGAVYLTSHKALAYEKFLTFKDAYMAGEAHDLTVGLATGDEVTDEAAANSAAITVATYEKWYQMIVSRPDFLTRKSLVIVDELQMLGDEYRGRVVEALLTWTRAKNSDAQILGLSATIPNVDEVSAWLGAKTVRVERRPTPLVEQVWTSRAIYQRDRDIDAEPTCAFEGHRPTETLDVLSQLTRDGGMPAVVFCVTRNQARDLAEGLGSTRDRRPACEPLVNELDDVSEGNPTNRALRDLLPRGIAFHIADLSLDERRLVEEAFRDGQVDVVFATPTLSAGVNLPIRTVVFDDCYRRWIDEYLSSTEYLNMAGRAGRHGIQESGRSVLIARNAAQRERFMRFLAADPTAVQGRLLDARFDQFVLQAIVGGVASSRPDVVAFHDHSLSAAQGHHEPVAGLVDDCVETLVRCRCIDAQGHVLRATPLGARTASSGVLPETGLFLFRTFEPLSRSFDWGTRERWELPVLHALTSSPELSPSINDQALVHPHRTRDNPAQVNEVLASFSPLSQAAEDPIRSGLSAAVLHQYVSGADFRDIMQIASYAHGAKVRQLTDRCALLARAAASIEETREAPSPNFRRWLILLASRLRAGVIEDAVELHAIARFGDVRGLGRRRLSRLAGAGLHDLTKLLDVRIEDISRHTDSTRRAEQLRTAVVAYLDDRSRHHRVRHSNRASEIGRDAGLIEAMYDSLGLDFNRAALRLLQTIIPNVREQDTGGTSDPDLAIPLGDGLMVIECKTKASDRGTVGLHDAFEVIGKSTHLNPVARVTLGKPQFDALPVARAPAEGIGLVTHVVLCEAVLRIWEGTFDAHSLIAILRQPGLLDEGDLAVTSADGGDGQREAAGHV